MSSFQASIIYMLVLMAWLFMPLNASFAEDVGVRCDNLTSVQTGGGRTPLRVEEIDANAAQPVCDWAVQTYPEKSRYSFQLGKTYEKLGSAGAAMDAYLRSSKQGNADAAYRIGLFYIEGRGGFPTDPATAFSWFRTASDRGLAAAHNAIGLLYDEGRGIAQNHFEATKWLEKAAAQGDAAAQVNLARRYASGIGSPKDEVKAFAFMQKAADQNDAYAQYSVAFMLANGQGVPKDLPAAIPLLRKSADQGNALAQYALGISLLKGEGVSQDIVEALEWFHRSAKQNNAASMLALGNMHADGTGVPKHPHKAAAWYKKAVANGNDIARKRLEALNIPADATPPIENVESLREVYASYLTVKTCYDMRKEYLIRIVGEQDMATAKMLVRKIEDTSILTPAEKDKAWKDTDQQGRNLTDLAQMARMFGASGYSDNLNFACQAALNQLREVAGTAPAGARKRDF